ncbi:MAG TPA: hypothetical protein VI540_07110 [Gaiellaceae bacterium]|nr:hypothetical protein [Gaiellaceae bacterium]
MSPDAFRRLALLAASSAYAAGIGALVFLVSWQIGLFALVFGGLVTIAVTIEQQDGSAPEPEKPDPDGLSRRDVARLAAELDELE